MFRSTCFELIDECLILFQTRTMKIYTRKGDDGTTTLYGGGRIKKHHLRIEAYGTVDELNSHVGFVRDQSEDERVREFLLDIQNDLFNIGSHLATVDPRMKEKLPNLPESIITKLEIEIDAYEEGLEPMKNFVLPGGHPIISSTHIARCVCRRTERIAIELSEGEEIAVAIIPFLNRLSDYLFVLARKFTSDLNIDEIPWKP